jgi:choline monooxygenase
MELNDYTPQQDLSRATTLPARWYADPAFLALEKEKIFWRTWQRVGYVDRVAKPGDYFACDIAGEPLVVVRDAAGPLRALSNVCRHRASTIACGEGNCTTLRCPYHGWTYALDGRLLGQPEFEGVKDWDRAAVALPEFRVDTWGPFVFVYLDPQASVLADVLSDIPEHVANRAAISANSNISSGATTSSTVTGAILITTRLSCPAAHPGLLRELDYKQYRVDTYRHYSSHYAPLRTESAADRRYASPQPDSGALYYWIFPNFMLNIYPDNMSSNIIVPLGHDRTLTIFEWFFDPAGDPTVPAKTMAFSDQIQQEDIRLCEGVQVGLQSRTYDRGRLSVKRENGVHHFHLLMHEHLARSVPGAQGA